MQKLNEASTKEIKALIGSKKSVAVIKGSVAYLASKQGIATTDKEVVALLATLGYIAPKRSTGFRAELYEALEEGNVSDKVFANMLVDASDNTLKNEKHYNAIRTLCNTVRANVNTKGVNNA